MSIGIDEIVINRRSGVVHTKNCEAVKQMKESNKDLTPAKNIEEIEQNNPCGHCIKKRDMELLYKAEYQRRVSQIEKRRQRDHDLIDKKYDEKLEKVERIYKENIQGLEE